MAVQVAPDPNVSPVFNIPSNLPQNQEAPLTPVDTSSLDSISQTGLKQTPAQAAKFVETDPRHMGVAGTARDILGTLGDVLLHHLGIAPMYGPAQQRRREAEAQVNFNTDPNHAIQQLTAVNPASGEALRNSLQNEQIRQTQAQTNLMYRQQQVTASQEAAAGRARTFAANYFNGLATTDPDKRDDAYATMRKNVLNSEAARNDPKLAAELADTYPQKYDENAVVAGITGTVPAAKQWALGQKDRSLNQVDATAAERARHNGVTEGQGQQNADAHTTIANAITIKDERQPNGPRPTEGDIVQNIINRQAAGQPVSPGESARVQKFTQGTGRTHFAPPAASVLPTNTPTIPANRVPAGARTGSAGGRRIVDLGGGRIAYIQ